MGCLEGCVVGNPDGCPVGRPVGMLLLNDNIVNAPGVEDATIVEAAKAGFREFA